MKNWELIKNTKITIRVRLGTKTVLLYDIRQMGNGSVIELDKLANHPMDIMVGSTLVAQGEVVIVDGNFGIQVTKMIKAIT